MGTSPTTIRATAESGVCHPLAAHVGRNPCVRSRGRVLPGRGRLCRHGLSTGAAHPIYGGAVRSAIEALAPSVAMSYMLWGEPLQATAAFMEEVRAVAVRTNHRLTFSLSPGPSWGIRGGGVGPAPETSAKSRRVNKERRRPPRIRDRCGCSMPRLSRRSTTGAYGCAAASQVPGATRRR